MPAAPMSVQLVISSAPKRVAGNLATIRMRLMNVKTHKPLTMADLKLVHTRRIHMLLIDKTLTDYHHVHPQPDKAGSEFTFTFTPHKDGDYRVWADITPVITGKQVFPVADLAGSVPAQGGVDKTLADSATISGFHFRLNFKEPLRAGAMTEGEILVTDAHSGKPFTALEPVMGAFAHIVAFNEDRATIAHVHPMTESGSATDRSGPAVPFHFMPGKAGFTKIYAQIQVAGKDIFAPFGVEVAP